jgi:hypothetical protein
MCRIGNKAGDKKISSQKREASGFANQLPFHIFARPATARASLAKRDALCAVPTHV